MSPCRDPHAEILTRWAVRFRRDLDVTESKPLIRNDFSVALRLLPPGPGKPVMTPESTEAVDVLGVIGEPVNGVGYVRFAQPFARLEPLGFRLRTLGRSLKLVRDGHHWTVSPDLLDGASMVVFPQMVASPLLPDGSRGEPVAPLILEARRRRIPIVYSVDDWLPALADHNPGYDRIAGSIDNLYAIVDAADAMIVTTSPLAERLAPRGRPVHLLPNAIDPDHWTSRPRSATGLRIGWTGSSSHVHDLLMVAPAIRRLRRRLPFRFVIHGLVDRPLGEEAVRVRALLGDLSGARRAVAEGFLELVDALEGLDLEHVPFCDFERFRRTLPALDLDIGICPLEDSEFNRCKSALKFYEYAAVGTLTVASNVTPYRGEVSVTATNDPVEWCEVLERYLRDPIARERELERQRAWVMAERNILHLRESWVRVLRSILTAGRSMAANPLAAVPAVQTRPVAGEWTRPPAAPRAGAEQADPGATPSATDRPTREAPREATEQTAHDAAGAEGGDPRARVGAVMLTCGQWDYTRRCIGSLTPDLDAGMQLIVVDNASPDATPTRLKERLVAWRSARVLASPVNLGFAAGSNLGALHVASNRHVLFVNNDVVVPRGWLERLVAQLEASPSIGIVGPRSNRIAGGQQLQHVEYDEETLEGFEALAAELARRRAGQSTPVSRLIGFCMLVRREVIDAIGGLDPRYGLGNFEDDDFCVRARLAGFEILQAEDVVVHHFGGRTFAGRGIDRNAAVRANWEVFKRRWGLPSRRSLTDFYSDADFAGRPFDPERDRVALDSYRPRPLELGDDLGFRFLLVARVTDPSWEQAARSYLGAFTAEDDVALLLRADPPERTAELLGRTEDLLRELEMDGDRCADVIGVDLPLRGEEEARLFCTADALLLGEQLDERRQRYAALAGCPVVDRPTPWALRATTALISGAGRRAAVRSNDEPRS